MFTTLKLWFNFSLTMLFGMFFCDESPEREIRLICCERQMRATDRIPLSYKRNRLSQYERGIRVCSSHMSLLRDETLFLSLER